MEIIKQEILDEHLGKAQVRRNARGEYEISDAAYKGINSAMTTYAKEVALAFYKHVEGVLPDNVKPLWDEFEKGL